MLSRKQLSPAALKTELRWLQPKVKLATKLANSQPIGNQWLQNDPTRYQCNTWNFFSTVDHPVRCAEWRRRQCKRCLGQCARYHSRDLGSCISSSSKHRDQTIRRYTWRGWGRRSPGNYYNRRVKWWNPAAIICKQRVARVACTWFHSGWPICPQVKANTRASV